MCSINSSAELPILRDITWCELLPKIAQYCQTRIIFCLVVPPRKHIVLIRWLRKVLT